MHELSIALSIVDGVLEEAKKHGCAGVRAVHLRLGQLSGVDREALLFTYPIACADTPLASSRLEIVEAEGNELEITAFEPVPAEVPNEQ